MSRPPGGAASHRGHGVDAAHGMTEGSVRLTGGREICIRPIEPCDAPELKAGFQRLTAVSRYRRFLSGLDHLTAHQLQYLTTVDHADHEALVAVDAQSGDGIGVARYVRDANDPRLAELAIVVTDAWQGRGVGTALLEQLVVRARVRGNRAPDRSLDRRRSRGSGARRARRRRRRPPAPPRHRRVDRAVERVSGHASRGSPAGRVRLTWIRPTTRRLRRFEIVDDRTRRGAGRTRTAELTPLSRHHHWQAAVPGRLGRQPRRSSAVPGPGFSEPTPRRGRHREGGDGRADQATWDRCGRPPGCRP